RGDTMHEQVNWASQDAGSLIHLVDPNGKGRGDDWPGLPSGERTLEGLTARERDNPARQTPRSDAELAIQNVLSKLVQKFNDVSSDSSDATVGQALVQ